MNLRRWLTPGIGIKRWLLLVFAGLLLLALGVAHALRQSTRDLEPGGVAQALLDAVTLQFLPYELRGLTVGLLGFGLIGYGGYRLVRAVTEPFRDPAASQPLVELIYRQRSRARGPRIVAIGGGTGLSALLRGLKERTSNLTAVVTVADDGGSSGSLRTELGIPPVGDIRNCLVALADTEPLMRDLLQYRFPMAGARPLEGDHPRPEPGTLGGHALGNLLIAALTELSEGDFEEGVREMNRVLAVRGRVVPVTPTPLTLHAAIDDGTTVVGQSAIARAPGIERVWLTPEAARASADALAAIAEADLIVVGPGSLYTSLLPSLLVPGIADAMRAAHAVRIFVCNVATQEGETADYDLAGHVEAFERHTGPGIIDVVLANSRFDARQPSDYRAQPVRLRWPPVGLEGAATPRLVLDDIVDPANAHYHEPERLATAIVRILEHEGPARAAIARSA
jgi:uncharacterized cofD-like protein